MPLNKLISVHFNDDVATEKAIDWSTHSHLTLSLRVTTTDRLSSVETMQLTEDQSDSKEPVLKGKAQYG